MIVEELETYELTLIPTERCNINCTYCLVDKSAGKSMSFETAKCEIDKMMAVPKQFAKYIVSFMGGEPFLAFDLIRQVVDYVKTYYLEKPIYFTIVTNGTLVNDEVKRWIVDKKKILHITLSLDGMRETHNKNRCKTYDRIDIPFFTSLPSPTVNMVISPNEVENTVENIKFLESCGFYVKAYLEEGNRWTYQHIESLAKQLSLLIDYYLHRPNQKVSSLLRNSLFFLMSDNPPVGCGKHKYAYHISADGARYDCHRCMPFENPPHLRISEKYINDLSNVPKLNEACDNCFISYFCNLCPASNAARIERPDLCEMYCMQRKVLYKAQSYMILRMLTECPNHCLLTNMSSDKLQQMVYAAKIIMRSIDLSHPF